MENEETHESLFSPYGSLQMIFIKKQSLTLSIGIIFCSSNFSGCFWLLPTEMIILDSSPLSHLSIELLLAQFHCL
jgi:hypothetical protein